MPEDNQAQQPDSSGSDSSLASGSLTRRVASGMGWMFLGQSATWGAKLAKLITVAAVLDPNAFGLFGLVLLTTEALRIFTLTGFHAAVVQREELTEEHLDTAWTVLAIRGLFLAGLMLAMAPVVGWFFEEPRIVPILRAISPILVLQGFANIGTIYFPKKLRFKRQFIYKLVPALVNLITGVGWALYLRSVWALVISSLTVNLCQWALSYILHPYRPSFSLDMKRARELISFGKWVFVSAVLGFLVTNGDDAFLGRFLGIAALGIYQFAYKLSSFGAVEVGKMLSSVIFPSYALMQNDIPRLRRAYLRVLSAMILTMGPISAGIAAVSPVFIHAVVGSKWAQAIVPLQLLCIFGFLRTFKPITGTLFMGVGEPKWQTKGLFAQAMIMAALIWPATHLLGIEGTCGTVALALLLGNVYAASKICRILDISRHTLTIHVTGAAVPSLLMFLIVMFLSTIVSESVAGFIILILSGILSYAVICGLLSLLAWRTSVTTTFMTPFRDSVDILQRIVTSEPGDYDADRNR